MYKEIDFIRFNNKNMYYGEIENERANGYGMFKNSLGQIKYGYFEDNKYVRSITYESFCNRMLETEKVYSLITIIY